jgi:hypothetical protein
MRLPMMITTNDLWYLGALLVVVIPPSIWDAHFKAARHRLGTRLRLYLHMQLAVSGWVEERKPQAKLVTNGPGVRYQRDVVEGKAKRKSKKLAQKIDKALHDFYADNWIVTDRGHAHLIDAYVWRAAALGHIEDLTDPEFDRLLLSWCPASSKEF